MLSALLVCLLFAALHLAMLGVVPWQEVPTEKPEIDEYTLPFEFMKRLHQGDAAVRILAVLLIGTCLASVFSALLGYSRIPYAAAREGHFFAALGRVHPVHHIPHVALLAIGALTLFWSFFDLGSVINALITTRIVEQFIAQVVGVVLLRRTQPDRLQPFRMWLYPLPCGIALVGWLYLYLSAPWPFIVLGLVTLAAGILAFLIWAKRTHGWPFEPAA